MRGDDPAVAALVVGLTASHPDVVLLTDIDFDAGLAALSSLQGLLARSGLDFPYAFARRPNNGTASGVDMDGDGRLGEPEDALAWGRFAGQGGMAVLSRFPIDAAAARDLTQLIWRDLPFADPPRDFPSAQAAALRPLSTGGHWIVPIQLGERRLTLLAYAATPPAFDGPERLNARRNRDELLLWRWALDGGAAPTEGFVLLGNANLDPTDGGGDQAAMRGFLADPRLQDPMPRSRGGAEAAEHGQTGDPALDTADWPSAVPGNLRVSYVLPSADLAVTGAGVLWPAKDDPMTAELAAAGAHHLVWVDITVE